VWRKSDPFPIVGSSLRLETWAISKISPAPFTCEEDQIHFMRGPKTNNNQIHMGKAQTTKQTKNLALFVFGFSFVFCLVWVSPVWFLLFLLFWFTHEMDLIFVTCEMDLIFFTHAWDGSNLLNGPGLQSQTGPHYWDRIWFSSHMKWVWSSSHTNGTGLIFLMAQVSNLRLDPTIGIGSDFLHTWNLSDRLHTRMGRA